ncbi:MAG: amidase domain-containing protein [Bifidobacteriaceae bacterium]|nr:amidase domain-containing protein [Bifidobacteriaceae bacterium]
MLVLALLAIGGGALRVGASGAQAAGAPRFVPANLSASQENDLSTEVAAVLGAAYAASVAPTAVASTDDVTELVESVDLGEEPTNVTEIIEDEILLSEAAAAQIEDLTEELQMAQRAASSLESFGIADDEVASVEVTPGEITATTDTRTGELAVLSETVVNETYETGVVSTEIIDTLAMVSPGGEFESFVVLDPEAYAEAARGDSGAYPVDPSRPGSEDGVPVDLGVETVSILSAEQAYVGPAVFRAEPGSSSVVNAGLTVANKKKVVEYAVKWATSYNSSYRKWVYGDCTNFVSQAMRAGGWKDDLGWYRADENWWYNSVNQSYTWSGAENWFRFARNESKRAGVLTSVSSVVPGDVIQIKYSGKTEIGHSMIVTKKSGLHIYVSFHTNNTLNKSLADVIKSHSNAKFYAHKI